MRGGGKGLPAPFGAGGFCLGHHLVKERNFFGFRESLKVSEHLDFSRVLVCPLGEKIGSDFVSFGFGELVGVVHERRMIHFDSFVKNYF